MIENNNFEKNYEITDNLILGFHHGGSHHYYQIFPYLYAALKRLSSDYNFTLKIVTNGIDKLEKIQGIPVEYIEWELESHIDYLKTFDIGLCPYFSDPNDAFTPWNAIRNPNRINTLLSLGIPSVASPTIENASVLNHHEHVLFSIWRIHGIKI